MNITKQYIDLCKNPKVQGLRHEFYTGDVIYMSYVNQWQIIDYNIDEIQTSPKFEGWVWIPTSDQLDQCIVDICKRHNLDYQVGTTKKPNYWWWVTTTSRIGDPDENIIMVEAEENPLICKLKLLISLLESEE